MISIVTIVLNGYETIERTIKSVIGQSYTNFEYIVIDGGSTDGTLDILKNYASHIKILTSEKDRGISDAFNKGISLASGNWVSFINADDWYQENALAELAKEGGKSDIFYGRVQYWDNDGKREIFDADHNMLKREMTLNHPACFFKRSVFTRAGSYNLRYRYSMDYELLLRCLNHNGIFFKKTGSILANMSYGGVSDNHCLSYREVRRAKLENGAHPLTAHSYYYFQLLRKYIRKSLCHLKMSIIVDFYRKYIATIKKM